MRTIAVLLLLASPVVGQVTGHVDYLYWQANSSDYNLPNVSLEHCGSGVRAGLGYRVGCWEPSWNYTYFTSGDSDGWSGDQGIEGIGLTYLSDATLTFQHHDIQLQRYFNLHPCCELSVFGGFRWARIDRESSDTRSSDFLTQDSGISYQEWAEGNRPEGALSTQIIRWLLNTGTDSYGGRLGGHLRVQLTDQLSWFAESAFAGLVSVTESDRLQVVTIDGLSIGNEFTSARDKHETIAVDAATGLSWTYANIELATGYEWHFWSNILQRQMIVPDQDYRDLVLEGLFARFAFVY